MNELKKYINDTDTEEIRIFQEDIISVKHKKENPHQIDPSKHWLATNLIAEEKEGRQVWIGKVIGKNQRYIHFRDNSKRSWVDVKGFENQIEIGDYLAIDIDLTKHENGEKRVKAKRIMKVHSG